MLRCVFILMIFLFPVSAKTDAQVINAGIGGNNTINLLARLDSDVIQNKPDLVILMVGTNDMLNTNKMLSYQEYEANLEQIVKTIQNSGAQVLLMCPPPLDSVYLFERHDRNLFQEIPNVKLDSARNIIQRIARMNNLLCIDLFQKFTEMNLPKHNEDLFFINEKNSGSRDGVHLTSLGYHYIAETIFQFLKTNNLLNKDQTIVCFGDSITFGSKVKGSGTADGETYPAYLQTAITNYYGN